MYPVYRSYTPAEKMMRSFFNDLSDVRSVMKVDVKDEGDRFHLIADIPGMNKEDISVTYKDKVLTIKTNPKEEVREDKKDKYLLRERKSFTAFRQFRIENIKEDEISASFENGTLNVELPKIENEPKEGRNIEIR